MTRGFALGARLPVLQCRPVSHEQVLAYVEASGDDNPIHADLAVAHTYGLSGIVLPGMLIAAQFPRVLEAWERPHRLLSLDVRFLTPLDVDRPFVVTGRVAAVLPGGEEAILRLTAKEGVALVAMGEARIATA